jgi:hypothetical protein
MKGLPSPRGLRWTKDRVRSFRAQHHIHRNTPGMPPPCAWPATTLAPQLVTNFRGGVQR